MKHIEYTTAVEFKEYPEDVMVPLGSSFMDDRGTIQNLIESAPINAVAIIHSKAGTERSNHWHKESDHYLYCLSGKFEYYERELDQDPNDVKPIIINAGEMVYTKPRVIHLTKFLEDTVLVSLGSNSRSHDAHESDLIRENFF